MQRRFIPAVVLLFVLSGCTGVFFQPLREHRPNPVAAVFAPEDILFRSDNGVDLHGWFFRAKDAKGSVLVLHGNAQNISTHVNSVLWMVLEGFNVFIIDYRGYGRSGGSPSVDGVHRDAEAALKKLLELPGVDRGRIAVLGQSLGGSVAVYTVVHSPERQYVRMLVIDSAFASYRRIAREKMDSFCLTWPLQYPLSWTVDDDYSAERFIKNVSPIPLVVLHGEQDPVVPTHHGRMLFEAASEPKQLWLTQESGHVMSFGDEEVRKRLARLLKERFAAAP